MHYLSINLCVHQSLPSFLKFFLLDSSNGTPQRENDEARSILQAAEPYEPNAKRARQGVLERLEWGRLRENKGIF